MNIYNLDSCNNSTDSYTVLENRIFNNLRIKSSDWTPSQRERINQELAVIKQNECELHLLLYCDLVEQVANEYYFASGAINNLFVAYLLGITNVDAHYYKLPYQRFASSVVKPDIHLCVQVGSAGKIANRIEHLFGASNFTCKGEGLNCTVYKTADYTICVEERNTFNDDAKAYFTEAEIYQKTKDLFANSLDKIDTYKGIAEVESMLKDTDGKLVYQEQFIEICSTVLGISPKDAEILRLIICKSVYFDISYFNSVISSNYGKEYVSLVKYLANNVIYAKNKAHVIGELSSHKHF